LRWLGGLQDDAVLATFLYAQFEAQQAIPGLCNLLVKCCAKGIPTDHVSVWRATCCVLHHRLNIGAREHYCHAAAAAAPSVFSYALWTQKRVFSSTEPNTAVAAHATHNEERADLQVIAPHINLQQLCTRAYMYTEALLCALITLTAGV
jgi:hypothetical protein